jgi:hypothetical protein
MLPKAQVLSEIDTLVNGHALHGSESLCKLLRYLASHALEHPGVPLKEYQIATEVFGRQADFDPQLDSMVRVQAGRLRTKLSEHYSTVGASDAIWAELPKGTYVLTFHEHPSESAKHQNGTSPETPPPVLRDEAAKSLVLPRKWVATVAALSILLAASLAVIGTLLLARRPLSHATVSASEAPPATFQTFWTGFLAGPQPPLVIFSNAQFVGRPDAGMRYFDSTKDAGAALTLDHYTGVGEVLGVHDLDMVFGSLHQSLRIKRGSLFTLDDAKNNNLIFIGSPSENLALLDIPSTKEFTFRRIASGVRKGDTEVVNAKPQPGEPGEFLATASNQPLTEDYAVVALVPGLNRGYFDLVLAGTTTIGTQAAVEFVCGENTLKVLLTRLSVSNASELKPFEAVIHVKVARGVPVESEIVALRNAAQR